MNLTPGVDPLAVGMELRLGRLGRENAATKALRLLTQSRVAVHVPQTFTADVRGDSGVIRRVSFDHGYWSCTCPFRSSSCSHIRAVQQVVLVQEGGRA